MVTKVNCDKCGRSLIPGSQKPDDRWLQAQFTNHGSLDFCDQDMNILCFAIDRIIQDEQLWKKFEEEYQHAKDQALQAKQAPPNLHR